ncbi:MAG: CsbD family protein [Chloroflexota bacterium]
MAGMKERMAGRFMQWEGKVTGDPIRRTEGKLVAAFGRFKQAVGSVRRRRAARPVDARPAADRSSRT